MRFVSFFAGIGGFDLGLERAGHECVGQVEIDPYAIKVLEKHWPDVPRFGDIRTLDPATLPDAELWCGGFPCQPFSVAGRRKGSDDERDLWPAWFALIADRRPRWVFGENVPGLLSAEGGKVWGRIVRDLASVGYVGEWTVLGADDVGAPHRRKRLWLIANLPDTNSTGRREESRGASCNEGEDEGRTKEYDHVPGRTGADVADSYGARSGATRAPGETVSRPTAVERPHGLHPRPECWCGRGEPWCCDPADGAIESFVGRVAHGVPKRVDRLSCLGNAVVPQVVEAIAKRVWG